jgi:hypothetical protein
MAADTQSTKSMSTAPNSDAETLSLGVDTIEPKKSHPRSKLKSHCNTYTEFRFRAVVDWIKLRMVTVSPSNFNTARRRIKTTHVKPLNEGAGGAATEFEITIQDPTSWASINEALARFTVDHPLAEPITVTGIEISLDAYGRYRDREDLVNMAARFYKFATKVVSKNRRMSMGANTTQGIGTFKSLTKKLSEGFNVYIGNSDASVKQHIYVKDTDTVKGERINLPIDQHRARTEFTLGGDELPHASLTDWQGHDFTSFAEFFRYRVLKKNLHPMVRSGLDVIDQIGERRERQRKCGGVRLFSKSTVADTKLNNLAYSALR